MPAIAASVADYPLSLRAVASHGLPGSRLEWPQEALGDDDFDMLHDVVRAQKLTGLFWSAIEQQDLPVTADQWERAEKAHLGVLAANLRLEELLIDTAAALDEAGIPVRALKGTASAHLDYAEPSQRTFGDIDILVPSHCFDAAVSVLEGQGHRRKYPEPRRGFNQAFGKGVCLRAGYRLEIDLHRTFTMGPFGQNLALDDLWRGSDSFTIGGRRIECLDVEARLLHAAYHATLGEQRPRLAPLRDVAQILLNHEIDWSHLHQLMVASHGEAVVARSIGAAWRELMLADVLLASTWADAYDENDAEAAQIGVYGPDTSYALRSLAAVRALPKLSQKARYVAALAFPDRSYLGRRHHSQVGRLVKGAGQIRNTWGGAR